MQRRMQTTYQVRAQTSHLYLDVTKYQNYLSTDLIRLLKSIVIYKRAWVISLLSILLQLQDQKNVNFWISESYVKRFVGEISPEQCYVCWKGIFKKKKNLLKLESDPLSLSGMSSLPLTLKKHPCLLTSSKEMPSACPVFASTILYLCRFFLCFDEGKDMWPPVSPLLLELLKLNVLRREKRLPPLSS